MKILELYCGLGGLAAAVDGNAETVLAVDQNRLALNVYRRNFSSPVLAKCMESVDTQMLRELDADLWWASPPCQPYTVKGKRMVFEDPRSGTFLSLLDHLEKVKPSFFAMENVVGFCSTPAYTLLWRTLQRSGYGYVWEDVLCPSDLGIPNRRPRFFLVAGRTPLSEPTSTKIQKQPLKAFLDHKVSDGFLVDAAVINRFGRAMDMITPNDPEAVAKCFTGGYGKSPVQCGSYLRMEDPGRIRYFTPREIKRLLGFSETFVIPENLTTRQTWKLLGNSLSLPCVRQALSVVPGL